MDKVKEGILPYEVTLPSYVAFCKLLESYWKERQKFEAYKPTSDGGSYRMGKWNHKQLIPKLTQALLDVSANSRTIGFDITIPRLASGLPAAASANVIDDYMGVLAKHSSGGLARMGRGHLRSMVWEENLRLDVSVVQGLAKYGFANFFRDNPVAYIEISKHVMVHDLSGQFCSGVKGLSMPL